MFEARFFEIFPELPEANTPRWTSPTSHWSCPAFTLQVLQHMDGTTAVPPAALSMASGGAMTFPRWRMVILWVCLSHDIDKGNEVLTDPWALNPCIFRGHIGYVSIVIPGNWLGLKKGIINHLGLFCKRNVCRYTTRALYRILRQPFAGWPNQSFTGAQWKQQASVKN